MWKTKDNTPWWLQEYTLATFRASHWHGFHKCLSKSTLEVEEGSLRCRAVWKRGEHYWFPLSPYYLHHLSVTTPMVSLYHLLIQSQNESYISEDLTNTAVKYWNFKILDLGMDPLWKRRSEKGTISDHTPAPMKPCSQEREFLSSPSLCLMVPLILFDSWSGISHKQLGRVWCMM